MYASAVVLKKCHFCLKIVDEARHWQESERHEASYTAFVYIHSGGLVVLFLHHCSPHHCLSNGSCTVLFASDV